MKADKRVVKKQKSSEVIDDEVEITGMNLKPIAEGSKSKKVEVKKEKVETKKEKGSLVSSKCSQSSKIINQITDSNSP